MLARQPQSGYTAGVTEATPTEGLGIGGRLVGLFFLLLLAAVGAAVFIPSYSNVDRKRRNEVVAAARLEEWCDAQRAFRDEDREQDGVVDYATLEELVAAGLLDHAAPTRNGYVFESTLTPDRADWSATAAPVHSRVTGDRCFFVDSTGVVRWADGVAAVATSPPLGGR